MLGIFFLPLVFLKVIISNVSQMVEKLTSVQLHEVRRSRVLLDVTKILIFWVHAGWFSEKGVLG